MTDLLFPYVLPDARIAQRPAAAGESRLLHARLRQGRSCEIVDRAFTDLPELLRAGDVLVLNNTRVLPTRFFPEDLGASAEVLLLQRLEQSKEREVWRALARPMKRVEKRGVFRLSTNLTATVLGRDDTGDALLLAVEPTSGDESVATLLYRDGSMPIPPYIRQGRADDDDATRYQTIYAEVAGSVAAPTAGLHFTPSILAEVRRKGVEISFVTHHVGPASFLPVREGNWQCHTMAEEYYLISHPTYASVRAAKEQGRRIIAVGTTSVRALESFFAKGITDSQLASEVDQLKTTSLYITPGYQFQVIDALITNFHQPQSTHLLLVAAFTGSRQCQEIYEHGLRQEYRFLSYGDSMFLEPARVQG